MKRIKTALICLSIGLNIAFAAVAIYYSINRQNPKENICCESNICDFNCPLHRKMGVSKKQWNNIKPLFMEYQKRRKELEDKNIVARDSLLILLETNSEDTVSINRQIEKVAAAQRELQHSVINLLVKEKSHLSRTQERILFQLLRQSGMGRNHSCCPSP
ncbi:MAG: hypothetical protein JXA60_11380 [Candidatus Coatesbacteria bacterium]|nr:hypothetical protein [Candidatus Coatesbacteria bacterium]